MFSDFWIGRINNDYNAKKDKGLVDITWYEEGATNKKPNGSYKKSYRIEGYRRIAQVEIINVNRILHTFNDLSGQNKITGKIKKPDLTKIKQKVEEKKQAKSNPIYTDSSSNSILNSSNLPDGEELECGLQYSDGESDADSSEEDSENEN